jgi:hypothetical protein
VLVPIFVSPVIDGDEMAGDVTVDPGIGIAGRVGWEFLAA